VSAKLPVSFPSFFYLNLRKIFWLFMLSASDASARIPKLMSVKYFISFPSIQDFEIIILKSVKKSTIILTISGKNRFSFCAFHPDILIEK
jgi:hypothetical protein